MEAFVIILFLIICVVVLYRTLSDKIESLSGKIDGLHLIIKQQDNKLKEQLQHQNIQQTATVSEQKAPLQTEKPKTEAPQAQIIQQTAKTDAIQENKEIEKELKPDVLPNPEPEFVWAASQLNSASAPKAASASTPPPPPPIVEEPKPSFFDRYPDLEKFIGENIINKIGIGVLVLGIGYFVKYAIDKDWINEIGRVLIGLLCGGILIGVAHKLRKTFKPFSSVLVGGGLAVFYLTISIAFHQYHLMGQTAAFIVMAIITGFAVILSITYNRQELAVLAIIGGFSTPFILSTGSGNYIVLFTYLMILNAGMLVLGYFKKWNLLNIICYVFTVIIYGGWLSTKVIGEPNPPYTGALVFATLFYLVFFLMNIINNIKENRKFISLEIALILSNTFLYYSAGMIILQNIQQGIFQGLFTALIAVFNFGFAYTLYKNKKVDKNLLYLLIGLVLTFLSLAAPVQLEGNYITLFWAMEAVLLLWLSQKSGIKIIKLASVVVTTLMVISLMMDWDQLYFQKNHGILNIIINKAFITGLVSLASVFGFLKLLKKEENKYFLIEELPLNLFRSVLWIALLVLAYIAMLLELRYQLNRFIDFKAGKEIITGVYNFLWLGGLLLASNVKNIKNFKIAATILGFLGVLLIPGYYHFAFIEARNMYLFSNVSSPVFFLMHYIILGLVIYILAEGIKNIRSWFGFHSQEGGILLWCVSIFIVFLASAEVDHTSVLSFYKDEASIPYILKQSQKIGFPIIWGLCSFVFMFVGMRDKIRQLRIISLSLFLIILLKLFLFDIRGVSEGGKIAAFISLGVLLLIVSFMYQKLKKLVMKDEDLPDNNNDDIAELPETEEKTI